MVENFSILPPSKLPTGVKFGWSFTSFAVDTPKYLLYLKSRILSLGGQIFKAEFRGGVPFQNTLKAAARMLKSYLPRNRGNDIYAFVNASGMGGLQLAGDMTVFPLRSQTVWIKGEAKRIVDRLEVGETESKGQIVIYYACPRVGSGYTVLGGYMEEGNWYEISPFFEHSVSAFD